MKHVKMQRNFAGHNAGETCSLSDREADYLIERGIATLAEVPAGVPAPKLVDPRTAGTPEPELTLAEAHKRLIDEHAHLLSEYERLGIAHQHLATEHAELKAMQPIPGAPHVRAKMVCSSKKPQNVELGEKGPVDVYLHAVADTSEVNKLWAKYTPCASVNITIDNPPAQAALEEGKAYFVDFTPAE